MLFSSLRMVKFEKRTQGMSSVFCLNYGIELASVHMEGVHTRAWSFNISSEPKSEYKSSILQLQENCGIFAFEIES